MRLVGRAAAAITGVDDDDNEVGAIPSLVIPRGAPNDVRSSAYIDTVVILTNNWMYHE